ncbi:MAG: hypothetical protein NC299_11205 [Lachnospiraceae bacterium]|nr:hypothetical protein [Ruminococcus sp.]MCM1275914.1 hypothetical protein [Lachnospiraceae bacterium]
MNDEELRNAVDVVGAHYISFATDAARKLADEYGKELWFSEASPPMSYSEGTCRYDETKSGLSGINGVLDIANRFIAMYPCGGMTLCEYQPAIAAYYDGVTFCHKQLITANSPWSGYFHLESGFFMQLHFSRFFKKGWAFIDNACYCDAKEGGDGHALVGAVYSYMTAADLKTGDYGTVIVNTTDKDIRYDFTVSNLAKAPSRVYVWETRGPENDKANYDENYFKLRESVVPTGSGDGAYGFSVTVKPSSIITVSTVDISFDGEYFKNPDKRENNVLELPYRDDYRYGKFGADYLPSRGYAPRYTTDIGGAFEVRTDGSGNNYLCQIITEELRAEEWGWTPDPVTNFGDDRWSDYSVSADVRLDERGGADNYVGIGLRYNLASEGQSGYWIRVCADGCRQRKTLSRRIGIADKPAEAWTIRISRFGLHGRK